MATATVRSLAFVPMLVVSVAGVQHQTSAGTVTVGDKDREKMTTCMDGSGIQGNHTWEHQHPWRDNKPGHGLTCGDPRGKARTDGDASRWGRETGQHLPWDIQHGGQYLTALATRSHRRDRAMFTTTSNHIDWDLSIYMLQCESIRMVLDGHH